MAAVARDLDHIASPPRRPGVGIVNGQPSQEQHVPVGRGEPFAAPVAVIIPPV